MSKKNYRLPTEKILTGHWHGATLSIFVFRKKRSKEHFVFFLAYEVTTLKVIYRISCHLLTFWPEKSSVSFPRITSSTRAHETIHCNISNTLFAHRPPSPTMNGIMKLFTKRRRSRNWTPPKGTFAKWSNNIRNGGTGERMVRGYGPVRQRTARSQTTKDKTEGLNGVVAFTVIG